LFAVTPLTTQQRSTVRKQASADISLLKLPLFVRLVVVHASSETHSHRLCRCAASKTGRHASPNFISAWRGGDPCGRRSRRRGYSLSRLREAVGVRASATAQFAQNAFGKPAWRKIALAVWRLGIPIGTAKFRLVTGLCQISWLPLPWRTRKQPAPRNKSRSALSNCGAIHAAAGSASRSAVICRNKSPGSTPG
jgi:hypothetical protein